MIVAIEIELPPDIVDALEIMQPTNSPDWWTYPIGSIPDTVINSMIKLELIEWVKLWSNNNYIVANTWQGRRVYERLVTGVK